MKELIKLNVLEGINLDFNGGSSDEATEELQHMGIINKVYDPINRSQEHNDKVISDFDSIDFDSITCLSGIDSNVLESVHNMTETTEIDRVIFRIKNDEEIFAIKEKFNLTDTSDKYWDYALIAKDIMFIHK